MPGQNGMICPPNITEKHGVCCRIWRSIGQGEIGRRGHFNGYAEIITIIKGGEEMLTGLRKGLGEDLEGLNDFGNVTEATEGVNDGIESMCG